MVLRVDCYAAKLASSE